MFEYALFLTGDDANARSLQRAAFLDAHQALLLGGRLRAPRAWLLRAVRDTATSSRPVDEELMVLRSICGLRGADSRWVLGGDAEAARRGERRGMRIAGAGAGAAMAARASTAKALAAQVPGFSAASATGATHLIVVSAVAGTALVGTAAITTKLEQHPHPQPIPVTTAHTSPGKASSAPGASGQGKQPTTTRGAAAGHAGHGGVRKAGGKGAGHGTGQGARQSTGQGTARQGTGRGRGQAGGQGTGQGQGTAQGKRQSTATPPTSPPRRPTSPTPPTTRSHPKGGAAA